MISDFKVYEEMFQELSEIVAITAKVFVIGGATMLYRKKKPQTKDLDVVVKSKKEFFELRKAFLKIGFKPKIPGVEYSQLNLSEIFEKDGVRVDLFNDKVCGALHLSDAMVKRSEKILSFEKLKVYLCSNEDILVFKAVTTRDGDKEDCFALTEDKLKWNLVLKEIEYQIKKSGQDIWITRMNETLEELIDKNRAIPIIEKVRAETEKYYAKLEKELKRK
jgi:hypothetical protein